MVTWMDSDLEAREEKFSSKFIQIIGKISLLAVVGLRSPFTCKLLAQGCLLLLEATCISHYITPSICKVSCGLLNSHTSNPCDSSAPT